MLLEVLLAAAATAAPPPVHPVDCGFEWSGVEVDCGYVEVLENRGEPGGREIPVHFVRARATGDDPRPDPIVYLGGGPGMHATPRAQGLLRQNRPRLVDRDLIVVDQRGTGRSNPLDCIEHDGFDTATARKVFGRDFFDAATFRACAERLSAGADLTQYTTTASVEDVEAIRRALGYRRINLSGGSYGTRWALEYMRRHPESVRAAVLRGVAPSSELLVERVAADFDDVLEALVGACEKDRKCKRAYPDFREQLDALLERVRKSPVSATVDVDGEKVAVEMNYGKLVTAMRFLFYSAQQSARLPQLVADATEGNYDPFASMLMGLTVQLHNLVGEGLWASVKCTEELPFIDAQRARRQSKGTVLGTLRLESELEICSVWPRGEIPADFNEPVVSKVPALLFSGEFDPATPPELAERAVRGLENGLHVVVANRSHWGLSGSCVEGLIDRFLDSASVEGIDPACAAEFERPPFSVD